MQEKRKPESVKRVTLVKMRKVHFKTDDGRVVNLEECSPKDFDVFISQYVKIKDVNREEWDLMMRWRVVNFALRHGKVLDFLDLSFDVEQVENK